VIFDELDRNLLRELQKYSWQSNTELAAAVDSTPAAVAQRCQSLVRRGVLRGCHADVDLAALGRPVQALVFVRVRATVPDAMETFYSWVSSVPEMVNVFVSSGASDFVVHVAVATSADLYAFVTGRLVKQSAVLEARTNLVFEHTHARVIEPVDEPASRHSRAHVSSSGELA
jgi:DNA-binding Lrp family transcriptional regulator